MLRSTYAVLRVSGNRITVTPNRETSLSLQSSIANKRAIMLSEKMVSVLSALAYRPDAEWEVNILPFGSIFWKDEMPEITDLFDRPEDMMVIHRMFGTRIKLWDGEALDLQEQQMWDAVRVQVPRWALFKRVHLSEEQKLARAKAERQVEREFQSLGDDSP